MGLFKNEVGRPSNETKRKRRIIVTFIIVFVIAIIGAGIFTLKNYFSPKELESNEKNAKITKIYSSIEIKNNNGILVEDEKRVEKSKYMTVGEKPIEVELLFGSNNTTLTIRTRYDKKIAAGSGFFSRRYYQVKAVLYDQYDRKISSSKQENITQTTMEQNIKMSAQGSYIRVYFYDNTKNHQEVTSSRVYISVKEISNMKKIFADKSFRTCILDTFNSLCKSTLKNYCKKYSLPVKDLTDTDLTYIDKLTCDNKGIKSVDGVEKLKNITNIQLYSNQLTTLYLANNSYLEIINANSNNIKSVSFPYKTIKKLFLYNNNISAIDVSRATNLDTLNVTNNELKTIDVSKNTELLFLFVGGNQLSSLNVTKNKNLVDLEAGVTQISSINLKNNPYLARLDLRYTKLTSLDVSKNTRLEKLFIYEGNSIKKNNVKLPNVKNLKVS